MCQVIYILISEGSNDNEWPSVRIQTIPISTPLVHCQTLKETGIDNTDPGFTHSQIIVTCFLVGSANDLYILYAPNQRTKNLSYI